MTVKQLLRNSIRQEPVLLVCDDSVAKHMFLCNAISQKVYSTIMTVYRADFEEISFDKSSYCSSAMIKWRKTVYLCDGITQTLDNIFLRIFFFSCVTSPKSVLCHHEQYRADFGEIPFDKSPYCSSVTIQWLNTCFCVMQFLKKCALQSSPYSADF